jgi:hypothetical protein
MNHRLPKLPIGIQDFSTLRTDQYVYVDKTQYLYNLITSGKVYFLSRPRRFGKSLLISTLEAIFKGQKELFKDTWIAGSDYVWTKYPVIRMDMSRANRTSPESFAHSIRRILLEIAKQYEIFLDATEQSLPDLLDSLITLLSAKGKVVVLIDEYDKPILDNLSNLDLAQKMRDTLRQFYTIFKAQDGNLKFVMLTGVTKFSKVSVFSDLNNLQDITITDKYATLCGYTQSELTQVFDPWIQALAVKHKTSVETQYEKIKSWYNGYQFSAEGERVYNPFSTLLLFEQQSYRSHWFATGTPKFLIDKIDINEYSAQDLESLEVTETALQSQDIDQLSLVALLYQAGYLTIRQYDERTGSYCLDYPNLEVHMAFTSCLLSKIMEIPEAKQSTLVTHMLNALYDHEDERLFTQLKAFFASIPYHLHKPSESYYHSLFFTLFRLMGCRISAETSIHLGRLDAMIELPDRILIFEFKLNQSAEVALKQIHDKQYYQPYQALGKTIVLFGVSFNIKKRNIVEWVRQEVA